MVMSLRKYINHVRMRVVIKKKMSCDKVKMSTKLFAI